MIGMSGSGSKVVAILAKIDEMTAAYVRRIAQANIDGYRDARDKEAFLAELRRRAANAHPERDGLVRRALFLAIEKIAPAPAPLPAPKPARMKLRARSKRDGRIVEAEAVAAGLGAWRAVGDKLDAAFGHIEWEVLPGGTIEDAEEVAKAS